MKISPVSASANTAPAATPEASQASNMSSKLRAIKMATNVTPGHEAPPVVPPPTESLTISDTGEQAKPATEETKPLSPQLAAIAKQRRALQVKEREILEREKALEARSGTPSDAVPMAHLKSDPLGTLIAAGVTFDELTQAVMAYNDGHGNKFSAMEAKIKALEEGLDKKLSDREVAEKQQVLAAMRSEATQLVNQGDTYELVRATRNIPTVMRLIETTYDKTGEVLDVSEACSLVEEELLNENLKLAKLQKVQSKLAPQSTPPQQRQMRTLTNRDTANPALGRKERALAAFHNQLK